MFMNADTITFMKFLRFHSHESNVKALDIAGTNVTGDGIDQIIAEDAEGLLKTCKLSFIGLGSSLIVGDQK